MKHQIAAAMTGMSMAVAAAVIASATACNVQQPPFGCQVQRLTWAAKYNLAAGEDPNKGPCAKKGGERLGVQIFNNPEENVGHGGVNALVIQPEQLGKLDLAGVDPTDVPYSSSLSYPNIADENGFCVAQDMTVAQKKGTPSGDIVYHWSNVRVVSKADAPGTQLVADLDYTAGGCTAKYEVWANWPSVFCGDPNTGAPSDAICQTASTLNSEFLLVCDPTQKRCVPGKKPPSYK